MNFNPESPKPNTLKNEHLDPKFKPIIGGIYDRNNLDKETLDFLNDFKKNADFVDFKYKKNDLDKNNMHGLGDLKYVISSCNENKKYSLSYLDCTGLIVSGIDKVTGKNISIMSHQNPESFLKNAEVRTNLKNDINRSLDELISRSIPGSIDAVLIGGQKESLSYNVPEENFRYGFDSIDEYMKGPYDDYIKSVKFIGNTIYQKLGFSPVVMTGPNDNFRTKEHALDIYFDNDNRRLYMLRPEQDKSVKNEPYIASEAEDQIERIKNVK